ncbi:reverse transcriptase (RNA-dependent DNA polymerase) [Hirsutella rhossiliensis]|uniref:Reverse transcriptase (RNA-dependent DNA polymerase) domain-containing protein n=1 Tax=Hirsutella rhossiliensis TaxID=111463 RepID=A0A9P8N086_9HYPO|nr:reverse transcriptase (RNA-dependent DNA polymerase) domain-containing protein [Hirsutella rhossiliensis]KAH0965753.1 reverse transcriptase (RNA-dependent DNA polymerase) domain-containing protein [Hirsutella rhossiliensis]
MKRFEELVRAGATALPRLAVEPRGLEAGRGAVSPTPRGGRRSGPTAQEERERHPMVERSVRHGRGPDCPAGAAPGGDQVFETQTEKANALRVEILERRGAADDIRTPGPQRCWPQEDSRLQRHARGCGMRLHLYGQHLPGIDGITVRMLRRVWNHIGEAGAFDTVLRNRLLLRLRNRAGQQTWSGGQAAMEQRSARIRLEDITTPTTPLTCGLPQGSPASPILFLLYTVPIYSIGEPNSRFGYADDVAT